MKHKNSHARSKQRRKALRMKNTEKRIQDARLAKLARKSAALDKGKTIVGNSSKYAVDLCSFFPKSRIPMEGRDGSQRLGYDGKGYLFDHDHARRLNQRQRRKKLASNPHLRK